MSLTGQELTLLALDRLAGGSPAKLVRELQLQEVMETTEPAKNIARWRDGKNEPSYAAAMRMLERLGLLSDAPATRTSSGAAGTPATAPGPEAPMVLLESVLGVLEQVVERQEAMIDRLARLEQHAETTAASLFEVLERLPAAPRKRRAVSS